MSRTTQITIKAGSMLIFTGILILISSTLGIADDRMPNNSLKSELSYKEIEKIAKMTTVRINTHGKQLAGSGVIVRKNIIGKRTEYLVLSSAHVIDFEYRKKCIPLPKDRIIEIETHDGKIHSATIHKRSQDLCKTGDLALLHFSSDTDNQYEFAQIANSNDVQKSATIYVSGFPCNIHNCKENISIEKGTVSAKFTEALKYGYKIGYTAKTKVGTSGGSLLSEQSGKLIGIHGRGQINGIETGDDYKFNSSKFATPEEEIIIRDNAWAIPSELFSEKLIYSIQIDSKSPKKNSDTSKVVEKNTIELLEKESLNKKLLNLENKLDANEKYIIELKQFNLIHAAIHTLFLAINLFLLLSIIRYHKIYQLKNENESKDIEIRSKS